LNYLYASSYIVFCDTLCKNFDFPYYFSDRLFEVSGRGGFIIFPYIKGIKDHFDIGNEIVTYQLGNFDELMTKIDYYLRNDSEREAIRLAGHERTKKEHTYKHRLTTLLNTIFQ
jgi:spore maturation protein CgeB